MRNIRRDFLKMAGLAGLTLSSGGLRLLAAENDRKGNLDMPDANRKLSDSHVQHFNMSGFAAPKLKTIRIGIIGLGKRGPGHVNSLKLIEGVEIKAICDIRPERTEFARKLLEGYDHSPEIYTGGENEWKKVCDRKDIDLIYNITPLELHTPIAVYTMERGKHIAVAIPAAGTIEECWKLVQTAERTRKHCYMLDNAPYEDFQVLTLNMARQGFLGDVVHADCAYIESKEYNTFSKDFYWDMWRLKEFQKRRGNFYPTHGLCPVANIMNINRGDKFEFLTSVESRDFSMGNKLKELASKDDFYKPYLGKDFRGNINSTLIRTTQGRTIMLQHDFSSPRAHTYIHGIYGTKASAMLHPDPPRIAKGQVKWTTEGEDEFKKYQAEYTPQLDRLMGATSRRFRGHGGDFLQDWYLIDCLRNGLPLGMDVYDAASISSIVPLSQWSVLNRSNSIDIPDFTAGAWKTNKFNMDITLSNGGGNTKFLWGNKGEFRL